jgi:hypothetical protein
LAKNTGILAKISLIVYPYLLSDYLLSANIGDNRDAFHAGYNPAIRLITNESSKTVNRSAGNIGVICA